LLVLVAAPAAAESPFSGCTVKEPKPGERRIHCPDFEAAASEEKPAFGAEATLDLVARGLREDSSLRVERVEVTVAGAKRPGVRYAHRGGTLGLFAAFPSSEDKFRVLSCEEKKARRCDVILNALAASIPAPNAKAAPANDEKSIAGRALVPPSGCSQPAPRKIVCPNVGLSWATLADDDPPGLDWMWNPLKKAFATQGPLTESRRPCTIDGVESECRQLAIAGGDGRKLTVLGAMTTLRGARLFVQCNITGALESKVPAPCDLIFTLR
jgi:hypothetical protein